MVENSGNGGKGESCKRVQWRKCEIDEIVQSLRVVGVSGSIGGLGPPTSVFIELEWNWWNRAKFVGCWGQWQHRWRQHQQQRLWHHQ